MDFHDITGLVLLLLAIILWLTSKNTGETTTWNQSWKELNGDDC